MGKAAAWLLIFGAASFIFGMVDLLTDHHPLARGLKFLASIGLWLSLGWLAMLLVEAVWAAATS